MGRLLTVWDRRFREYDFGPGHPFAMAFRELATRLFEATLPREAKVDWIRSVSPAAPELLETFHTEAYVQSVERSAHLGHRIWLDSGDTPSFPGCDVAAARIVQGTASAVLHAREHNSRAFQPFGGLHHAHPDRASGFCIYNDLAIGIRQAVDAGLRVAYVDIDAHHGDGVMYGFYDSGRVLDIDFHQDGRTLFPGTGAVAEHGGGDGDGLKINVPLPPGCGDDALVPLFERIVPPLFEEFRPGLIVLQHGVDAHVGDPLAQLQYTTHGYEHVVTRLLHMADRFSEGRLVVTGGGGYDPANVSLALARSGHLLAGEPTVPEGERELPPEWRERYLHQVEEEAPTVWNSPRILAPSPWDRDQEEALVQEISATVGRRFPRPG